MKNKVLKLVFISVFFILIIGLKTVVNANSISSINMDIYVDNNGNAEVTEVWSCNTTDGTEGYHPYYNLGNSQITNLSVYDNTKTYTSIEKWDTSLTMNQKAYKCGINEIDEGVELCWGISQYGENKYTIKYNISNFVSELTDSQMMYWTLIPYDFSTEIENVKIIIHAGKAFSIDIPVWGYGKEGALCYIDKVDGAIHMDTDGTKLGKSEYMTFLAKFPKETFNTNNKIDKDFNYYYNLAQGNTEENNEEKNMHFSNASTIVVVIAVLIRFLPALFNE